MSISLRSFGYSTYLDVSRRRGALVRAIESKGIGSVNNRLNEVFNMNVEMNPSSSVAKTMEEDLEWLRVNYVDGGGLGVGVGGSGVRVGAGVENEFNQFILCSFKEIVKENANMNACEAFFMAVNLWTVYKSQISSNTVNK